MNNQNQPTQPPPSQKAVECFTEIAAPTTSGTPTMSPDIKEIADFLEAQAKELAAANAEIDLLKSEVERLKAGWNGTAIDAARKEASK